MPLSHFFDTLRLLSMIGKLLLPALVVGMLFGVAAIGGAQTVTMTDRVLIPWKTKVNPLWWLVGPDGWTVPDTNNGAPYLPDVRNIWLRRFYWFVCRNPLMNFVGYVIGVEDRNFTVTGSDQVLLTTGRDGSPQILGWRWAIIKTKWLRLPYVNFYNGKVEFYLGWRPSSGGFGLKIVFPSQA